MLDKSMFLTILIAFAVTVILSPFFIPFLHRLKYGQSIREEGPKSHQKKSGTPTMGGIVILIGLFIATIVMTFVYDLFSISTFIVLFTTLGYGLIGFLDDYIKVVKKRNLGLTSLQKIIGQLLIAIIFFIFYKQANLPTNITIPSTNIEFELSWLYFILIIVMLVGASNAVNLTDGLDGLVAGTASIAFGAFAVIAIYQENMAIAIFCLAVVGALLGFLVFNAHPAKVFMGDTGSLALGAAIAAVAIMLKVELLLIVIGGVFVIETLSVMMQVTYFKLTGGKRIFKMSPLHHHYELSGWSEWKVVITFWIVGALLGILGIYIGV
ncbi:MAG: phospho-N-acetylmuramoyl-pentapeptide-transferase [Bacillaceae bacterium]